MKKIIFILFFFIIINIFLFSQDYIKEYDRIDEILNSIQEIRSTYIFLVMFPDLLDNLPPDIEKDINKIIYELSTPGYIKFENDINSHMYELLFNMLIDELEYVKRINKDIHKNEYWTSQIIHTLDNAVELCVMIILMIALNGGHI